MENCKGTIVNNNYYCCCCGKGNTGTGEGTAQVGTIIYAHILQPGYVKANGDLLDRSEYVALYQYAKENNLILSEADWVNDMQGMFAEGDGVNTFRVPDLRGQFLRGVDDGAGEDAGRVLGSKQGDAIRNIVGDINSVNKEPNHIFLGDTVGGNGVFKTINNGSKVGIVVGTVQNYGCDSVDFDASRVVPTANENRPKNIALIAQIKY